MKQINLALILILISSILASTFALAQEELSEISQVEVSSNDLEESIKEVNEKTGNFKRVGFADVWRGNGWISNSDKGYLISGLWAHQAYSRNESLKHLFLGRLFIAKVGNFRLIKTTESDSNTSLEFYVVPMRTNVKNLEEAKTNSAGTLSLTKTSDYSNMAVWSGTLVLNSGDVKETYTVSLATSKHNIKPSIGEKVKETKQETRKSFWQKMNIWKKNK